jgi:hypothetical protein
MMIPKTIAPLALLPVLLGVISEPGEGAEVTLSIEQAVAQGKIDLEIKSLGRSTGPCMKLVIRRRVPDTLHLTIDSGIVFKSTSGKVQNMVGAKVLGEYRASNNTYRPDGLMILANNATHSFVLEAYCLDSDKPTPGLKEGFLLGGIDIQARGVLELAMSRKASISDIQMAIWIDRPLAAGVTVESMMARVRATTENVRAARSILAQLKADGLERWVGSVGLQRLGVRQQLNLEGLPSAGSIVSQVLRNLDVDAQIGQIGSVPLRVGALEILDVRTCPEVKVVDDGASETKKAATERTLLVVQLGVLLPASLVSADDFAVQVGEESFPAFALSSASESLTPEQTPAFAAKPAEIRPRPLAQWRPQRWQVGFEIPQGATQGTLVWRSTLGVDWSLDR